LMEQSQHMQRVYKDIRHAPVTVDLQEGPMGLVGHPFPFLIFVLMKDKDKSQVMVAVEERELADQLVNFMTWRTVMWMI
jgi:disulfide bond formation protein DsbB